MKYRNKETGEIVEAKHYYAVVYRPLNTNFFNMYHVAVGSFHAQYEPVKEDN